MQSHFWLMGQIRWRIFRNSLWTHGKVADLLAKILIMLLAAVVTLGAGAAMGAGAYSSLRSGRTQLLVAILWLIFGFWQLIPVIMEGTTPGLNFREIARYPIPFRVFALMHTAYGLLDPAALMALCWLACVAIGAVAARPGLGLPVVALFLPFVAVNLLLNRVVFEFLERILSTRRGRERFFAALLAIMLLFQVGMVSVMEMMKKEQGRKSWARFAPVHRITPPGLVYSGLTQERPWAGLAGLALQAGAAALILRRQLWLKYRGEVYSETRRLDVAVQAQPGMNIPFLPDTLAAIVEKEGRYLLGNSQTLFAVLTIPFLALLAAAGSTFTNMTMTIFRGKPTGVYPSLAGFLVLAMGVMSYNCFAFEAHGFARWTLAPIHLRSVILGKNLILMAAIACDLLLVTFFLSLSPGLTLSNIAVVTAAVAYASLTMIGMGNLFSVWAPAALEYGTMSSRKVSSLAVLGSVLSQFTILGSMMLVFYLARRWGLPRLPPVAFLILGLLAMRFYWFTLGYAARYADRNSDVIAGKLV